MGKGQHADNSNRNRQRFKTWLSISYPTVHEIEDNTTLWHLRTDDGTGQYLDVAQPVQRPEIVIIQATVTVIGPVKRQLADLSPVERKRFICDLRINLLSLEVFFRGVAEPLDTIIVNQSFFMDTITRDSFLRMASTVYR